MVPAGGKVLDVGCGRGDVLAAVQPAEGVGVDISPAMVASARADHPKLTFVAEGIEDFRGDGSFDAALCVNTLEYTWDVGSVLRAVHTALRDNGRVVITAANPVWSPLFKMASALGLRIPESKRLFITSRDLMNLLEVHGFEVVYEQMHLAIPKWFPVLSGAVNFIVSRIPGVRLLSSTQLVVARKVPPARREYSVSVIIPCHNERDNVAACARSVGSLGSATEIIFVDDGSTDGTTEAVKAVAAQSPPVPVKLVSYSPRRGKGRAVMAGIEAATGEIIVIVDADLSTHPDELAPLYEAFATGRAEFVNGTRFMYPMEGRAMRWANYMGNRAFTILVSTVMERRVSDTLCGTKAFFKRDYKHFTMGRDPWGDYDLLFGAAHRGLVLRELPVHYRERAAGQSKMKALRHTMNLLKMCAIGFRQIKI